jgi:signal transduction histidine kinase
MAEAVVQVLLVDDDEDEYVIVGDLLRAACAGHYHLTWKPTYEQGLQAIQEYTYDVCLVDYRLGQLSGLDLLAVVLAQPNHPPMILLTGEGDRGVDETATRAGAADYLLKDGLTAALLDRSIRYAVEHGRALKALGDASELAQSMNAAKSAFVAAMSHEIRTPVNAILGMAEMLRESQLDAEQRDYLDVLLNAGAGLLLLINDILDLSKIEAGHLVLERVEFDLEQVVDQAIDLTAGKARAQGIALLSHLSPGVATRLMGDPNRLRQILINLLGNAVKFTASGEVLLTAYDYEAGESRQTELAVSDTGVGIPPDKLETIFDDFTQADASTTRNFGGTGLGLGISRRLAQAMDGSLTAISSVGSGSTFRFIAHFDTPPDPGAKVRFETKGFHGQRLLLICDNRTSSFILHETLEAWGLQCDAFHVGADAVAHLLALKPSDTPYSVAVIDIALPRMGSFDTAAEIKRISARLPIVMLASEARSGDIARRVGARLAGYALKPVARSRLLRLISEALQIGERTGPQPAATRELVENAPVTPARILIAEDSETNRLLVQAYLKASPYQLTFEHDGKAAVDRFAASDFDLVLMDMQLPVMDGLAATRAMRELERERGVSSIPILALSANASAEDLERSAEAGCTVHLSKPISKLNLLGAIEKYRKQSET